MARARLIASSLGTSEKFSALGEVAGELCDFAQALFPLLVVNSDDYGRLDGSAFTVKVRIFPISAHGQGDFERAIQSLEKVRLIRRYLVTSTPDGQTFPEYEQKQVIEIVGFDDHQRGLHKRTRSLFPNSSGVYSNKEGEIPTEPKRIEQNGTEPKRSEVTDPRDLVSLWNAARREDGPGTKPLPQVRRVTQSLLKKIRSRLDTFPDVAEWSALFHWMNGQAWCRANGTGHHAGWTASLQWVVRSDDVFSKLLDKALNERDAEAVAEPERADPTTWDLIRDAAAECVDSRAYSTWWEPTKQIREDEESTSIVVGGPALCVDWIQTHYQDVLAWAVEKRGLDHYTVCFEADSEADA